MEFSLIIPCVIILVMIQFYSQLKEQEKIRNKLLKELELTFEYFVNYYAMAIWTVRCMHGKISVS